MNEGMCLPNMNFTVLVASVEQSQIFTVSIVVIVVVVIVGSRMQGEAEMIGTFPQ
jgi:hypothetical protein